MKINNIETQNFGSRKIPRYLYHITDSQSFAKIKDTGKIKKSIYTLDFEKPAVFLFELKNLTKRWNKNYKWYNNNLAEELLFQCAHNLPNIVILKIPVAKLIKNDLRIRSLRELLSSSKNTDHVTSGAPASQSKKYKTKKEPIEYIYPHEISFNDVETFGHADNYSSILNKKGLKGVLAELFSGQPEEKCINLLK